MIALIIEAIPARVWGALAAIGVFLGAWLAGRRGGAVAAKTKAAEKAADDLQKAKDARDEVDSKSNGAVHDALGRWMRGKDK